MTTFVSIVILGIIESAVLALAALALTLQFGVTNYFNFGFGEWLTFGAFASFVLNVQVLNLNVWVTVPLAGIATAIMSVGVNKAIFAPFVRRRPDPFAILIVTFAVGYILNELYVAIFTGKPLELNVASMPQASIGVFSVGTDELAFLAIALACMASIQLILSKTRVGKSMRATADNRALAAACGLNTGRIVSQTWLIAGFLAGVAGAILAIQTRSFNTALGSNYIYLIFPAVVVGGIGRPAGAVLGSLIIGAIGALGALYLPSSLSTLSIFVALVAIVLLRPQGLLGESRRVSLQSG